MATQQWTIEDGGALDGKWIQTVNGYSYAIYTTDADSYTVRISPKRLPADYAEASTAEYVQYGAFTDGAAAPMVVKTSADAGYEFLDIPFQSIKFTLTGGAGKILFVQYNED